MADLYIAEYSTLPAMTGGQPMIAPEPAVTTQKVTYSTAAQSAAFNVKTRYIAVTSPGIFSYAVSDNPTATTNDFRIPADQIIFMAVTPGHRISAITNT